MGGSWLPSDQDASGRSFGLDEIRYLTEVLQSGTLTATKGAFSPRLEAALGELLGVEHVVLCASGSGAVHTAVAALDLEPGEEVITTSVTDMGAITAILYQGGIPVFADVDPVTLNVTAATIADRLSERTRGIIVTHLFGNPCDMPAIEMLARSHGIPVVEDAAQAYGAASGGRPVGTIGSIGCFSAQQGKHITSGEGGFVVTHDAALARRMRLFVNKGWPYGEPGPDHEFLAPNYRITELQSAVILAGVSRLPENVRARIEAADHLSALLADVRGVSTPSVRPDDVCSYWRYALRVDADAIPGGPGTLAGRLQFNDIAAAPRYIQKPAFRCKVIADQITFGTSGWPFSLARPEAVDYRDELFPGTYAGLEQVLVLPWNERFTTAHADRLAEAISEAMVERWAA